MAWLCSPVHMLLVHVCMNEVDVLADSQKKAASTSSNRQPALAASTSSNRQPQGSRVTNV